MKDELGIEMCCENCKMRGQYIFCDYFEYQKAICKRYDGDGQTPEQRIAELEAENEKWRDAFGGRTPEEAKRDFDNVIQDLIDCKDGKRKEAIEIVANHISKSEKMVYVRKLVKPLVWEYDEDDEIYSAPISMYGKYLQVSVFCEKMKSGYWRVCLDGIVCDRKTPEEAKEAAQDWLVSLVANACGLESEVRK